MSPITKFATVAQRQTVVTPVAPKFPRVMVSEPSHPPRVEVESSSFDFIGVRRRGNKSFVLRFETKDAENFTSLFQ